ncbi:hypothetical protein CU254_15395 [Amycolatopsis sp. AA4]|uniref:hypothetical protein n=1 Tax=Actinomycetes TaxID=1760 RepID=UPI0001B5601D|nr:MULTISPECIES: hypothetical protein [Actinomycetes]ATY11692.1 hypothetical protein CU254_15395 [Amycolatopsis sp. AA4]
MEFAIAEDEVWFSAFDVFPRTEATPGDDFVRGIGIPLSETEELHVSWDVRHHSVRIRYQRGPGVVVDVFRELVTVLTVESRETGPVIAMEYRAEGCGGRTCVETRPAFSLTDVLLQT